jgi:outer membrane lipoprotein SlyB
MGKILKCAILLLVVSACSKTQSQSQYSIEEVGQPVTIDYAVVLEVRPVEITQRAVNALNTNAGAPLTGAGASAGAAGAYMDSQLGSVWGSGVGAAEQAAATDKKGYEYTVVTESKITKTLVQYQNPQDVVFKPGDLVMLQNTGSFHRLLSTFSIPEKIRKVHLDTIEKEEVDTTPPPPPAPANAATPKKEGDR